MRCECCTRKLGRNEIVHCIRHGTLEDATDVFQPSKDSAESVVCQICGEKLLKQIYSKLNKFIPPVHYQ